MNHVNHMYRRGSTENVCVRMEIRWPSATESHPTHTDRLLGIHIDERKFVFLPLLLLLLPILLLLGSVRLPIPPSLSYES